MKNFICGVVAGVLLISLCRTGNAAEGSGLISAKNSIENGLIKVTVGVGERRNEIRVSLYDNDSEDYLPVWRLVDHGAGSVYEKLTRDRAEVIATEQKGDRISITWKIAHVNKDDSITELKYSATLVSGKYCALFEPLNRTAGGADSLFYYYFGDQMDSFCTDGETISSLDMRKPDGSLDGERKFNKYLALWGCQKSMDVLLGLPDSAAGSVSFYQGANRKAFMFYRFSGKPFILITVPFDTTAAGDENCLRQYIKKTVEENTP